jgi:hypothetical protein
MALTAQIHLKWLRVPIIQRADGAFSNDALTWRTYFR